MFPCVALAAAPDVPGSLSFDGFITAPEGQDTHFGGFVFGSSWIAQSVGGNTFLSLRGDGSDNFIAREDGTAFYFDGVDTHSLRGQDASGAFAFVMYQGPSTVYNGSNAVGDADKADKEFKFFADPQPSNPSYADKVTGVAFTFGGEPGNQVTAVGHDYNHFAIDNLRYRSQQATVPPQPPTPVPEPSTYAMMLSGIGAIGFMTRRRRQSHD
jgi:hypothetical protein